MGKVTTHTLEETEGLAKQVVETLQLSDAATVLALKGDLGSGKTAFTKGLAKALGVTEEITSPTFVIQKIYQLENQQFDHLIHIDAYRLESADELRSLGWDEIMTNPSNCIVLEWPEKVEGLLPDSAYEIEFTFVDEETREITSKILNSKHEIRNNTKS